MLTKAQMERWRSVLTAQHQQALAEMNYLAGGVRMAEYFLTGHEPPGELKETPEPPRDPAGAQSPAPEAPTGEGPQNKGTGEADDREAAGGASPAVDSTAADRDRP